MLSNVQSLLPKIDEFKLVISTRAPDVFCVTETWLNNSVISPLIDHPAYSCCRNDRRRHRGGGTAIYIRNSIDFCHLPSPALHERVNITITELCTHSIFLICIYIPPDLQAETLRNIREALAEEVENLWARRPQFEVIIAGDMNNFNVRDLCLDFNLSDIIQLPTRGHNILDHVLISHGLKHVYLQDNVEYNPPIGSADHLTLFVAPNHDGAPTSDERLSSSSNFHQSSGIDPMASTIRWHKVYDLRQSNIDFLHHKACSIDWDSLKRLCDVNEMWKEFYRIMTTLLQQCVPCRLVPITDNDKEWMTPITKLLILDKWSAFRSCNWSLYTHLKMKVKLEVQKAKKIWAQKIMTSTNGLWKLVKTHQKNRRTNLSSLGSEDTLLKILSSDLQDHFTKHSPYSSFDADLLVDDDWNLNISMHQVFNKLSKYPKKKAAGIDDIPTEVYVKLADVIAEPLASIFNQSCSERKFPVDWKKGLVVPIPKTCPPNIDKIRYVTLLPLPSKLLESLILDNLRLRFEEAYGQEQHGFRKNSSTTTALLSLIDSSTRLYDDSKVPGLAIVSFDLSRAFDCVNHALSLKKLYELRFPTGFLKWLSSYFDHRFSLLRINSKLSRVINMARGVPQGSVLGPPIFCTYIRSFSPLSPETIVVRYADDLTLVVPFESASPLAIREQVNGEVRNASNWCRRNGLVLNSSKSKCMLITRRHFPLTQNFDVECVSSLRLLGVYLNDKLTWDTHIDHLRVVCSRRLHILRKLRSLISRQELHRVFEALIQSSMDYACPTFVGLNKSQSQTLNRVVKRAHRIMSSCESDDFSSQSSNSCTCCIHDLQERRFLLCRRLWRKIEDTPGHLLKDFIPPKLPRSQKYCLTYCRTNKHANTFFPLMARDLNSILSS